MKNEWPHLLADLRAKRDALTQAIDVIEKNFAIPEEEDEPGLKDVTRPRRISRGPAKAGRRSKRASKRNERTNERAKRAPTGTRPRSLPDGTKGSAILEALRVKSPLSPGELAKALKIPRPRLAYQLKPLLQSGAVVAIGSGMRNRQFSLPPRSRAAKEAP